MKVKRLLRFYRSAEKLNGFLDGLMLHIAVQSGLDTFSRGENCADRLIALIGDKERLADLWVRLHGVIEGLTDADRYTLYKYARMRVSPDSEKERREIHRAVVKFTRRAASILNGEEGKEAYKLVKKYYCLLFPVAETPTPLSDGEW